jgi:glycosyltransferase involved in cell wall biosynthesis
VEAAIAYSIVIPVYKNEGSIDRLLAELTNQVTPEAQDYEVIFVIDGSPDRCGELLAKNVGDLPCTARIAFHSRNFGSFAAIRTGLEMAQGRFVAVMAADLQEPPSLIKDFFRHLDNDEADVVFGVRQTRDDPLTSKVLSSLFWGFYRRYVIRDMPRGGVDMFACNSKVKDAVLSIQEPNSSLIAQLFWVGFRRLFVRYDRQKRQEGQSAWNFSRKLRYMMDSILAFTDLPLMMVLWAGIIGCSISVILALVTAYARIAGYIHEAGYASLFILILFFGSTILAVQGILGCYIWRTAENTKRRPLRIVAQTIESVKEFRSRS